MMMVSQRLLLPDLLRSIMIVGIHPVIITTENGVPRVTSLIRAQSHGMGIGLSQIRAQRHIGPVMAGGPQRAPKSLKLLGQSHLITPSLNQVGPVMAGDK